MMKIKFLFWVISIIWGFIGFAFLNSCFDANEGSISLYFRALFDGWGLYALYRIYPLWANFLSWIWIFGLISIGIFFYRKGLKTEPMFLILFPFFFLI